MAGIDAKRGIPPGLVSGLLFFAVVLAGSCYIVVSKLNDFSALNVTSVPVLIMIGYAAFLGFARLFRLRDDQSGDNLYYMGFLFTLTSLAVSLYQFSAEGSAEQIVRNFGIAIASTIAGITLRILFNQMRRDPVEIEATSRLELAEASRRVRRELDSAVLEFSYFRRMTQQSMGDALDELKEAPDRIMEIKLTPLVQGLTRAIESFNRSAEMQAKTIEANLQQTNAVGAAVIQLMQELRAAEIERGTAGPWGPRHHDDSPQI